MVKVSVIMPVYNNGRYLSEAIESVLRQSFTDFELIIMDNGSTDNNVGIVNRHVDKRIFLLRNNQDFTTDINIALGKACGKYITLMNANDIMHIDRLRIQYELMEEVSEVTVCGTLTTSLGESKGGVALSPFGMIKNPTLQFLNANLLYYPTIMIRKSFLKLHKLGYENYEHAEDYKLCFEIAKYGGVFYIEPLPLHYYRIIASENEQEKAVMAMSIRAIHKEVVCFLIEQCGNEKQYLKDAYKSLSDLNNRNLISENQFVHFMHDCIEKAIAMK